MAIDVLERDELPFPQSLPEFQRLFPDEAACAAYLERARWRGGFICAHCGASGEPYRYSGRPGVLCCRKCRRETRLAAGTVMERTHTPLSVWFWAAYLVASQTPGMSAVQFQRLALRAMSPRPPMQSFTQNHDPLHLVGVCDNRIST